MGGLRVESGRSGLLASSPRWLGPIFPNLTGLAAGELGPRLRGVDEGNYVLSGKNQSRPQPTGVTPTGLNAVLRLC